MPVDLVETAIVSLADLQAALVIDGAGEQDRLSLALNAATRRAERLTRRILKSRDYVRRLDGARACWNASLGESRLYLPQWPVTAITRLAFDVAGTETDQDVWLPTPFNPDPGSPSDFDVLVRGDLDEPATANSYLVLRAGSLATWPRGPGRILLESTAGYNDEDDEFPAPDDLKNAIIFLAADEYFRRYRSQFGTANLNLGGQAVQYDVPQLFALATAWLTPYQRALWG